MEINDIIRLMQAVSENGLTSLKIEEGNLKLSIRKEKEQIITVAGTSTVQQMVPVAGAALEMAALPAAEIFASAAAGGSEGAQTAGSTTEAIDSDKIVVCQGWRYGKEGADPWNHRGHEADERNRERV